MCPIVFPVIREGGFNPSDVPDEKSDILREIINRVRDMEIGEEHTFDLPKGISIEEVNSLCETLCETRNQSNPGSVEIDVDQRYLTELYVYISESNEQ